MKRTKARKQAPQFLRNECCNRALWKAGDYLVEPAFLTPFKTPSNGDDTVGDGVPRADVGREVTGRASAGICLLGSLHTSSQRVPQA